MHEYVPRFLNVSYNIIQTVQWTNLCNHLPGGGGVLTGLDAKVPPPLQDVDHGLCWDVKAGRPVHLQLTRGELVKAQLLPRLQWSTWNMNIILSANKKPCIKVLGVRSVGYTELEKLLQHDGYSACITYSMTQQRGHWALTHLNQCPWGCRD